jgi:hypothetical protein
VSGFPGLIAAVLSLVFPLFIFFYEARKADLIRSANPNYVATVWKALCVLAIAGIPAVLLAFLAYKLLRFSLKDHGERLRWAKAPLSFLTGIVSAWMLYATVQRDYWDYFAYPRLKAQDAYIYPQLRYAVFDVVLIVWCLDGLIACYLLAQNVRGRRNITGWSYRTTILFIVLFGVLLIGGFFGMCIRSMGL